MKARHVLFALALAACVDPPETESLDQALASCTSTLSAAPGATMPQPVVYAGNLPADVSTRQAWIVYPTTQDPNGTWVVWQVDLVNRVVTWGATYPAGKRSSVFALIGGKVQPTGGIRIPPTPIGPGGTGWNQVNELVKLGDIAATADP